MPPLPPSISQISHELPVLDARIEDYASETKGGKPLPWPAAVKVADKVPCGEPKDCHHEQGKDRHDDQIAGEPVSVNRAQCLRQKNGKPRQSEIGADQLDATPEHEAFEASIH